jgi:hypothetical protein
LQGTCRFPNDEAETYDIEISSDGSFHGLNNGLHQGTVSAETKSIVSALLDEPELILDVTCHKHNAAVSKKSHPSQVNGAVSSTSKCLIDITLYGRSTIFEDVGSFFEDHEVHLQDPTSCKHIVPYHNPHRLPRNDGLVILTSDLGKKETTSLIGDHRGPDLLDKLTSQQDLAEAAQPPSIKSRLRKYSLALSFTVSLPSILTIM